MAYLNVENFYKKFDNTEVLKGISFSVEKGEVVSVIGSSGSGKTTLLRCINFLETPDEGKMTLDGETLLICPETKREKESVLRSKRLNFGLVFQSFNLFPQYNVLKNVTLAPSLLLKYQLKEMKKELTGLKKAQTAAKRRKKTSHDGKVAENKYINVPSVDTNEPAITSYYIKSKLAEFKKNKKEEILKDARELLEKTGLTDKTFNYPCQLSGGQQQRVAIARALALKPKILCFDEPTSALDPELTGEVLKVIRALKNEGRTMIIVTHEMGFAKNVSDKVIFMSDGKAEEIGDSKQIFENPRSEKLKNFLLNLKDKENL